MRAGRASHRGRGSSPHTRGARAGWGPGSEVLRIIPAYAGSTAGDGGADEGGGDHPRIRGEHGTAKKNSPSSNGSSPHTRGAPCARPRTPRNSRIIPAYAGSTQSTASSDGRRPDHPRIRGEHSKDFPMAATSFGSSPHTRGAHPSMKPSILHPRIIPAYAGSTRHRRRRPRSPWDHPRIRGEHPGKE